MIDLCAADPGLWVCMYVCVYIYIIRIIFIHIQYNIHYLYTYGALWGNLILVAYHHRIINHLLIGILDPSEVQQDQLQALLRQIPKFWDVISIMNC